MGQGSDPLNEHYTSSGDYKTAAHRQYDQDAEPEVQRIEEDIEHTRAEMSETINAIQERLSPQHIADQAREAVYDATVGRAKGFGYNMFDTIKENPLPTAIAALSIGWLVRKSSERDYDEYDYEYDRYGYRDQPYYRTARYQDDYYYADDYNYDQSGSRSMGDRVSDAADNARYQAQDAMSNVRHQAQDTAENVRHQAQQIGQDIRNQAQHLGHEAQDQIEHATEWVEETIYENPMMVGAVAMALGTAVGMMLPTARVERKVMGPTRDRVVNRIQNTAENTFDKVQEVTKEAAKDAADAATSTAKQEAREQGLTGDKTRAVNESSNTNNTRSNKKK